MWVFGYGSLLWNPGFEPAQSVRGCLNGFHRSFCMWSVHHRGTMEAPGLVLALDAQDGARCEGMAFKVRNGEEDRVLAYLRERELISSAYVEETHDVTLENDQVIKALCYVINRDHVQYTGDLALEDQAQVIANAQGGRGPNSEYLFNTVDHLNRIGVNDSDLTWLVQRVRDL